MTATRSEYLRRFLVANWLRPESALWYAHEAALVRGRLPSPLPSRSLELGCMDGITTYVMLGGELDPAFDVYADLGPEVKGGHRYREGADYFDQRRREGAPPVGDRPPADRFDVGVTWKDAHATTARELGIYEEVVVNDRNAGLEAFADGEFELVWGPNLYWLDELEALLAELRRVTAAGGRVLTVLPDRVALDHMVARLANELPSDWVANLDRGRYENVARQARELPEWERLFEASGLVVAHHEAYLPSLVLEVHDIGLRPLFPVLIDVYHRLGPEDRVAVKSHWIEVAQEFLAPLCDRAWMERLGVPDVWHLFELRPS